MAEGLCRSELLRPLFRNATPVTGYQSPDTLREAFLVGLPSGGAFLNLFGRSVFWGDGVTNMRAILRITLCMPSGVYALIHPIFTFYGKKWEYKGMIKV